MPSKEGYEPPPLPPKKTRSCDFHRESARKWPACAYPFSVTTGIKSQGRRKPLGMLGKRGDSAVYPVSVYSYR